MNARIAMRHLAGAGVIAALAVALYLPFLGNPWVFDDRIFFSGGPVFYYFATTPLGLGLRLPPYFSLAATETLGGSMAVHRSISLLFHIACALALYRLLKGVGPQLAALMVLLILIDAPLAAYAMGSWLRVAAKRVRAVRAGEGLRGIP